MRCECCDALLTPEETRIRFEHNKEFANSCRKCLDTMDIPYKIPRAAYEEEIIRDEDPVEDIDPYQEDFWNER